MTKRQQTPWEEKLAGKGLSQNGLIDPKGNFYMCEFTGHNDLYDRLKELGLPQSDRESERHWIKVSTGIFKDSTVFVMHGHLITGRQKVIVEKIVDMFSLLKDDGYLMVGYGNYICKTESGYRWEKDKR